MENYIQHIELINNYLNKTLSKNDVQNFENLLKTDSDFNTLYNEHTTFLEGLKRQQLKTEIVKAKQSYITTKWVKFFGVSVIVLTVVAVAYVLISNESTEPFKNNNQEINSIIADTIPSKKVVEVSPKMAPPIIVKDSILSKKEVVEVEKLKPLKNIETSFTKTPQKLKINTQKDTIIVCKEGTKLNIKANSFVYSNGDFVKGNVDLNVTEYYKLSDMILANLSTTSNGKQLETGGMLNIEAFRGGELLKLNSSIEISFPTENKKEGMQLFSGEWEGETINWQLKKSEKQLSNKLGGIPIGAEFEVTETVINTVYTTTRGKVEFIRQVMHDKDFEVDSTFINTWEIYQSQKLIRVFGELDNQTVILRKPLFKKENTKFKILKDDSITRGGHVWRKLWSSDKVPETTKAMRFVSREVFRSGNEIQDSIVNKKFEARFIRNDSIVNVSTSEINRYILRTSKLGWINCDRFTNRRNQPIKYKLKIKNADGANVSMVFKSLNSILPSKYINENFDFGSVAKDENVMLVAIKKQNGKLYLDIIDTKTEENPRLEFNFKEVSLDEMKNKLERLNKLF